MTVLRRSEGTRASRGLEGCPVPAANATLERLHPNADRESSSVVHSCSSQASQGRMVPLLSSAFVAQRNFRMQANAELRADGRHSPLSARRLVSVVSTEPVYSSPNTTDRDTREGPWYVCILEAVGPPPVGRDGPEPMGSRTPAASSDADSVDGTRLLGSVIPH